MTKESRVPTDPNDQLPLNLDPPVPTAKNVYQRLNEVRKMVDYAKKEKHVDGMGGGYKVVTHDQITALTRGALIAQGVLMLPVEQSSQTVLSGAVTSKNVPYVRFEAKYAINFVNVDDPKDAAQVVLTVHAVDVGDKAPGKALSYAVKAALLKVLNIETGEDDESRYADEDPKGEAPADLTPRSASAKSPKEAPVEDPAKGKAQDDPAEPGEIAFVTTKLKLLKVDSPAEVIQASGIAVTWDEQGKALVGVLSKDGFAALRAALKGKK